MYEGINCIREREITSVQHIYNILEQHPGRAMHEAATEANKDTMFLIRVTHSSGMLEGKYTADTVFPPNDHRNHRPRSWLLNGIKKIDRLRFLENSERSLGQAALQWLLADDRVASTLPNIYEEAQLIEFAKAPETPRLTSDELAQIDELYADNFGVEREEPKYKGTMELAARPNDSLVRYRRPVFVRRRRRFCRAAFAAPVLGAFVNLLENLADHRRRRAAAVYALNRHRLRKARRKQTAPAFAGTNPANHAAVRSLFFGPHCAVPVLPATSHIVQAGLMRRAGRRTHHIRPSLRAIAPSCSAKYSSARFSRT